MRVNDTVINQLLANDIETVFGIPGTQTLGLNKRIEATDEIRFIMARHETAVSHQAWGFAETSERIAATLVVPGPGDMNAMNGLKNALNDCTPLLHLTVETDPAVRGGDGVHETPPDTYDNVVKLNRTVETPESAGTDIQRAITVAKTPPQGPVRVGIPRNFLSMDVSPAGISGYQSESVTDIPADDIETATELLADSTTPIIIAGGGVRRSGASEILETVAEQLNAPVTTSWKGKGVFPEDHPLAAGVLSPTHNKIEQLLSDADTALAIGTDFDAVSMRGWSLPVPDDLIHITLHPDDIGNQYDPAVGIIADAKAALIQLNERLADSEPDQGDGQDRARTVREARDDRITKLREQEEALMSPDILALAREVLPRETIITADGGGLRIWMLPAFEAYDADAYVQPGSWATMGSALPAAMGAAVANPDRDVVAIVGDGGLMMALHELHTVVAESLPVVTLVANNTDYAIISEAARRDHDLAAGTYDWTDTPLNLTGIAENMGMEARRATSATELRNALEAGLTTDDPMLIEVMTAPNEPQAHHWMAESD